METPKAEIIQINPDFQGTHYPQNEIDELSKRAMESSLWEERFHNAAQANARLEKEKEYLFVFCKRMFVFIEHLEHRDKCQAGVMPCINCQAGFVAEDWRNRDR